MGARGRVGFVVALAACIGALAVVVLTGAPSAVARSTVVRGVTPFGHPKPSGAKPFAPPPGTASPWTPLQNQPSFSPGTMLLQSDGTVLVHDEPASGATTDWYRLTPDSKGSYIDGTWTQIASMPSGYAPLYFASAVLPDGRMIVEGGEYLGTDPNGVWTNKGAIYSPSTNSWTSVAPPKGWTNIGDAQSDVLPDGTFMLAQACSTCTTNPQNTTNQALLNASTLTWTSTGTGKADSNDEEGWNLEPSGQLLTVDTDKPPHTELYTPSTGAWSAGPNTVSSPINVKSDEIGPQVVMPGGNTLVVGAGTAAPNKSSTTSSSSALYNYKAGTVGSWSAGPVLPKFGGVLYDSADGPGSILPDGNVLFDVSKGVYLSPTHFFVYNASSNTQTQVADTPDAPNDSTFNTRMLALPNGQVLFDDGSQMEVYTAGGTPNAAWKPTITSSPATVTPGDTYSLSGTQLAGLSQGAAYGDDVQDNTNFPLVRITNTATGTVTYAQTTDWSSVSINPGINSSTNFTVPASTPTGASTIAVVANGIASAAKAVSVIGWSVQPTPNPAAAEDSALNGVSCVTPQCAAAGTYFNKSNNEALGLNELWNGKAWKLQSTPIPTGAVDVYLEGVSCTAADACTAVGYYLNSANHTLPLAERWNGSAWSLQSTPKPSGTTHSYLEGVSCATADACTAVGYDLNSSNYEVPLAEVWNGSTWKINSPSDPSATTSTGLLGVSCSAADACTAVGESDDDTLAEVWNGKAWKLQSTPNRASAGESVLDAVSCTAADACTAVGYDNSSDFYVTLAEAWNGSAWKIQTTANPSGAEASVLNGVSCKAADACTAVGSYTNNVPARSATGGPISGATLAEGWDGSSWQLQSTPATGELNGVSCTADETCTAVGDSGADTLAETGP